MPKKPTKKKDEKGTESIEHEDMRFKDPQKVGSEFVDIISETFGLSVVTKTAFKLGLAKNDDEKLRSCLLKTLKFLAEEYKK